MAMTATKGKSVEVGIITDTFKITGTLFIPLTAENAYSFRLSDFLNNPRKSFLALTNVKAEALPEPETKWEAPFIAVSRNVITMVRAIKD